MTKAIKNKWVKALRSGKYKQTSGSFCREVEGKLCYCVIGVLALVAKIPVSPDITSNYTSVQEILDKDLMWKFISLNDKDGETFVQLADIVDDLV